MRKLPVVILLVLVALSLVTSVTGCRGAQRYDSRLVAADSLMQRFPDSALAVVEALCPDSLAAEGDRAYRALLLTQARYKSYIPAESDSAINRALAYYRAHPKEREKLTRAYIYKGAVMEELGHPDSAMLYYKHAEATAAPDDYFTLGYINLRIGELYQSKNAADKIVMQRMRKAVDCFKVCKDTSYIIISKGTLGTFLHQTDNDSAIEYLNQAISLAISTNSPDRYYYQSKLAGIYFYQNDFRRAKSLAVDIIKNGKDQCDEDLFYYYAARSYIKLGFLDSALWVRTMIPSPVSLQDSFNLYLLSADCAKASGNMKEYGLFSADAERIHRQLMEDPTKSELMIAEFEYDSSRQQSELKGEHKNRILLLIGLAVIVLALVAGMMLRLMRNKEVAFRKELDFAGQEIKMIVEESEKRASQFLTERKNSEDTIRRMNKELSAMIKKNDKLEKSQEDIHHKASRIVRERNAALNELYQEIRIKTMSQHDGKRKVVPLMSLLKDINENKNFLTLTPKESFWKKLKKSVDSEFNGIATYIEKKYPSLSVKDHHLFWLLCANLSPQIIKLCMNYSTPITVSNNKRRFMKEKIGLDVKFEDFIRMYLNGELQDMD